MVLSADLEIFFSKFALHVELSRVDSGVFGGAVVAGSRVQQGCVLLSDWLGAGVNPRCAVQE